MNNRASAFWRGFAYGATAVIAYVTAIGYTDAKAIRTAYERAFSWQCEYVYPRSGRCTQPRGHDGGHPSWHQ